MTCIGEAAISYFGKYDNYWPVRDMVKLYLKYTSELYRKQGSAFRQKTKARKEHKVGGMD